MSEQREAGFEMGSPAPAQCPRLGCQAAQRELERDRIEDAILASIERVFTYQRPNAAMLANTAKVRVAAKALAFAIRTSCPEGPDRSAALRHVRDAMMTANAAIVLDGEVLV